MSDAPKKNTFDEIIKEATAAGLHTAITLTEASNFTKTIEGGAWIETAESSETSGIGSIDKLEEIKQLQKGFEEKGGEEANNYNYDYAGFNFSFSLKKGDKLPNFGEIKKVGSEDKVQLKHKAGEVLLIDVWATWCGPCQKPMQHNQQMLVKNAEAWKDKVRIVGVSVDDTEATVVERIQKKGWTSIEHLTLGGWDNSHDLIKMFEISGIPFVCLIDRNGIIDYIGHPSGGNLEKRINELILEGAAAAGAAAPEAAAESTKVTLGDDSWEKFRDLLTKLPAVAAGLDNLSLSCSRTRTYKNGKVVAEVEPLTVNYRAEKSEAEAYAELAKKIVQNLSPSEYKIKGFVNDPEAQFASHFNRIAGILSKNGLQGKPLVLQKKTLDFKDGTEWKKEKLLAFPNIAYQGKSNITSGQSVVKEFMDYYEQVQEYDTSAIDKLVSRYPFSLVGNKFSGIHNLQDYTDKTKKEEITIKEGTFQVILFFGNNNTSVTHTKPFVELLDKFPGKLHLHILVFDNSSPAYIGTLLAQKRPDVSIYRVDHQENVDVKISGLQSFEHTILVDGFGVVTHCGKFEEYSKLEDLVKASGKSFVSKKTVSPKFQEFLENLPNEELFKSLQIQLKNLKYRAKVVSSFVEESTELDLKNFSVHSVELTVALRTEDKSLVEPLLAIFRDEARIIENYIETIELPEGTSCADCKAELKLPYYYFYFSKVHKCVDCAEKQNKGAANKLERYPVNETSVLIISDRKVDVKRLGTNLQPTTQEECEGNNFMCNGCGNGSNDEARYICMGCRREPNPRDLVDFCFDCMKKCRGTDEAAIQEIIARNANENHEKGHALLRVQYGPQGYYQF